MEEERNTLLWGYHDIIDHYLVDHKELPKLERDMLKFFAVKLVNSPDINFDNKRYLSKLKNGNMDFNAITLRDFLFLLEAILHSGSLNKAFNHNSYNINAINNKDLVKFIQEEV